MIFTAFLINFRITCGKRSINFEENSWDSGNFSNGSSWSILMKFWENYKKILNKFKSNWEEIFKSFQKNYGNVIGKIEVVRNRCWYYEEILESFSEIISVKLGRNNNEIVEKLWQNIGNTSNKL